MKDQSIQKQTEQISVRQKKELIDGLLDIYNDYKFLYEFFQDERYKRLMELILRNMQKIKI